MLEIYLVWKLVAFVGKAVEDKGVSKTRYQVMAIILWICGELSGAFLGAVIFRNYPYKWPIYIIAIFTGLIGAGISILIVKLLPLGVTLVKSTDPNTEHSNFSFRKFGRSLWIPIILIILAVSCLFLSIGGAIILQINDIGVQVKANYPIIGTDIGINGEINQQANEISKEADAIYFGFDLNNSVGSELPIEFVWSINGNKAYSFTRPFRKGPVVVYLDRKELGIPEFNTGTYEVKAYTGDIFLASATFLVR